APALPSFPTRRSSDLGDTFATIEGYRGSGYNDTLITAQASARLYGGAGQDTLTSTGSAAQLYGDDGNDSLTGGTGNDTLDGGARSEEHSSELQSRGHL